LRALLKQSRLPAAEEERGLAIDLPRNAARTVDAPARVEDPASHLFDLALEIGARHDLEDARRRIGHWSLPALFNALMVG
jgi:hypothetical protein